jgi:hypothetical protein
VLLEALSRLVGHSLFKSKNFFATRHFYFDGPAQDSREESFYTLAVECAWRFERAGVIIVGSEDYYEKADDNPDSSWEIGNPAGHLQDQKLAELLGELREGDIYCSNDSFVVKSVEVDAAAGFRITFSGGDVFSVFPASNRQMEYLLSRPGEPGLVLMNGELTVTKPRQV